MRHKTCPASRPVCPAPSPTARTRCAFHPKEVAPGMAPANACQACSLMHFAHAVHHQEVQHNWNVTKGPSTHVESQFIHVVMWCSKMQRTAVKNVVHVLFSSAQNTAV